MQLIVYRINSNEEEFSYQGKFRKRDLNHYASDAAFEMGFISREELYDSIKRAMELCLSAGIPLDGNFKRIYRCTANDIMYDWKLSALAYRLVCLNGSTINTNVARLQLNLINQIIN